MKRSSFNLLFCHTLIAASFLSCETMVPDPIDPRLPIYSENGKNIIGAKIGEMYFKNDIAPIFISSQRAVPQIIEEGSSHIELKFNFWNSDYSRSVRLNIDLNGLTSNDWADMEKGFGKKFIFNETNKAFLTEWETEEYVSVPFTGQITVKFLKNEKIVAGTFGFKAIDASDREILVTYGRYDYGFISP